jgi:hypothetical protein
MKLRNFVQRGAAVAMIALAAVWFAPAASAHVHVGIGISVPGVTVGVGNCWRCGYWAAPPVYYQPAYPAPVYYPAPEYYAPRTVYYYGYGYYAPRYYRHHYRYYGRHWRGGSRRHGHH